MVHTQAMDGVGGRRRLATKSAAEDQALDQIAKEMQKAQQPFLDMVLDMINRGLKSHTYSLRANVLSNYFKIEESVYGGMHVMNCSKEVSGHAKELFKNWPTLIIQGTCSKCNCVTTRNQVGVLVEDTAFVNANPTTFIETICNIDDGRCLKCQKEASLICKTCYKKPEEWCDICGIDLTLKYRIIEIGDIFLFAMYNDFETNRLIKLNQLHRKLQLKNCEGEELYLVGAISYRGLPGTKCSDPLQSCGHYILYAYRRGNSGWMMVDDLLAKSKNVKNTTSIVPRLLMYVKCKK